MAPASPFPSRLDRRTEWISERFGDLGQTRLGDRSELAEIVWPELTRSYSVGDRTFTYAKVPDLGTSAERVARIFRNGADEMVGNRELAWHHDPALLLDRAGSGDWAIYGIYSGRELVGAQSLRTIRGDAAIEWFWACVDPAHRRKGAIRYLGGYNDLLVAASGAALGTVWVVTTHRFTQLAAEQAGYVPMGCLPGRRLYGGSDGRYYRHTQILYGKLYGNGRTHLQDWGSVQLTEKASRVATLIRELWEEAAGKER